MQIQSTKPADLLQSLKDTVFYCRYFKSPEPLSSQRFNAALLEHSGLQTNDHSLLAQWGRVGCRRLNEQIYSSGCGRDVKMHYLCVLARALRLRDWMEADQAIRYLRYINDLTLCGNRIILSLTNKATIGRLMMLIAEITMACKKDREPCKKLVQELYQEGEFLFSELHEQFTPCVSR